jgi:hypothetical protein
MTDDLSDSRARLEQLLQQVMEEKEIEKSNELAAEIWRVLHERDRLSASAI